MAVAGGKNPELSVLPAVSSSPQCVSGRSVVSRGLTVPPPTQGSFPCLWAGTPQTQVRVAACQADEPGLLARAL